MSDRLWLLFDIIALIIILLSGVLSLLLASGDRAKKVLGMVLLYVFGVSAFGLYFCLPTSFRQLLNPISLICILPVSMPILLCVYGFTYHGRFLTRRILCISSPLFLLFICYVLWYFFSGKIYTVYTLEALWDNLFTIDILLRILIVLACFIYALFSIVEVRRVSRSGAAKYAVLSEYLVKNMTRIAYLNLVTGILFLVAQLSSSYIFIGLYRMFSAFLFFAVVVILFREKVVPSATPLDEDEFDNITAVLSRREVFEDFMSEKRPFLDPDLTLPELASILQTNRTTLSNFIRQEYAKSFSALINGYRIEEFKHLVETNMHKSVSIDGLCFDSGFRSRSTFYRCFSEFEGMTPSEYIRQRGEKIN